MDISDSDLDAFEEDIRFLIDALQESFEATEARYHIDEVHDALYIEIEGLEEYSEDEIQEIASPLLEELDLDFEEIYLVPLGAK